MEVKPTSTQFQNTPAPQHSDVGKSNSGAEFGQLVAGAVTVAGAMAGGVAGAGGLGLGPLGQVSVNAPGGPGNGFGDASYVELIKEQQKLQKESAVFNSMSNISKTEHETRMAAIRNMKS